jgi:hypothetical protein
MILVLPNRKENSLHILNIVGYFMYISTTRLLLTCAKLYIKTLYLNFVF